MPLTTRQVQRIVRTADEQYWDDFSYRLRTDPNAPPLPANFMGKRLRKAYPAGLTGIPLEGRLKHLIAAPTPLSDTIPRVSVMSLAGWNGQTLQWRAMTGMNTLGDIGMLTSASDIGHDITYSSQNYSTPMFTIGQTSEVDQDDIDDAIGYNDPLADDIRMLSLSGFLTQERRMWFGNAGGASTSGGGIDLLGVDLSANTPTAVTVTPATSLTGANNTFMVVPLTGYGWINRNNRNGLAYKTNAADVLAFEDLHYGPYDVTKNSVNIDMSGGSANKAILLTWSTPQTGASQPRQGAYAYAIFYSSTNAAHPTAAQYNLVDVVGSIQSYLFTGLPANTRTLSTLTTAAGKFATTGYNGLLTQIDVTGSGAFVLDMGAVADPTTPLGRLTSNGGTGIVQIERALLRFFLTNGVAPSTIWMDAGTKQDASNIITGSNPTNYRIETTSGAVDIVGGLVAGNGYVSRFAEGLSNANNAMNNLPVVIPMRTSRDIPPGNIILLAERLPFPVSNIGAAIQFSFIREWYVEQYAKVIRSWKHGVYVRGGLQLYYPAGCGLITNIMPGPR